MELYLPKKKIVTSKKKLAESIVYYEGKLMDYNEYFFWPHFWEQEQERKGKIRMTRIMMGGRQISKSSTLALDLPLEALQANTRLFYAAPQESQAKTFVNLRLNNMLQSPYLNKLLYSKASPLIPKHMRSSETKIITKNDTFSKIFVNGSYIQISYSDGSDTGRIRGYSADKAKLDEAQSMLLGPLFTVCKYILRSSRDPSLLLVGTPLGVDEFTALYYKTTQTTYHVKCEHCNEEQTLTHLENIDIKHKRIVCHKCSRPLDTTQGVYRDLNPSSDMYGQHANMLMLPCLQNEEDPTWELISDVMKDDQADEDKKKQELLGVAAGMGKRLITLEELQAMPKVLREINSLDDVMNYVPSCGQVIMVGIDWGGAADSFMDKTDEEYINSHTAINISAFRPNGMGTRLEQHILWEKMYPIEHPEQSLPDIQNIITILAKSPYFQYVIADAGGGTFPNAIIADYIARRIPRISFVTVQMLPNLNKKIILDPVMIQILKRTALTEYFRKIKRKEIYQHYGNMQLFYDAVLSQAQYQDKKGVLRWKRRGLTSDDPLYSSFFAYLGAILFYNAAHELDHTFNN